MGIEQSPIPEHWNYFLCLEDDIAELARWIEPTKSNFGTYSIELARLLITAASEVDVVAKLICKDFCDAPKAKTIIAYQKCLTNQFSNIAKHEIKLIRYGLTFTPWLNWEKPDNPPLWWKAYNNVKHERSSYFTEATMHNVLNAVAALFYLLLIYYGSQTHRIPSRSKLFHSEMLLLPPVDDSQMLFLPKAVVIAPLNN